MSGAGSEETGRSQLPFSAVVGQEDAKLALILAAIEPRLGGVLLRGDKGSAKTTLARGLAPLLAEGAPFVELPLGATEDRVVGAVDVAALLGDRRHAWRPGLLAGADGGVLYVDEINLLADHLVDTLLDVAVSGVNRVERDGISQSHPARFVLVGSMNPEEGELRPQLLDRFGLCVEVRAPADPAQRAAIVRGQIDFERLGAASPDAAAARDRDAVEAERLRAAAPARLSDATIEAATRLALAVGAEGLRADLSLCRAAAALAGWEGRAETDPEDLRRVAPMVLAHRRRRDPFETPGLADQDLSDALDDALGSPPPAGGGTARPPDPAPAASDAPGSAPGDAPDTPPDADGATRGEAPDGALGSPPPAASPEPDGTGTRSPAPDLDPEETAPAARLVLPEAGPSRGAAPAGRGERAAAPTGRSIRAVPYQHAEQRVAVTATVLADAQRAEPATAGSSGLAAEDLRAVHAEQPRSSLVILAVDASGSMAARRRLDAARAAVIGLLGDAYRRRDRVALIVFRGSGAEVVLRPTGSVEIARARLEGIPTGGTTPLAAGLQAVTAMVRATRRAGGPEPVAVLITDGRATAGGPDPLAAADAAAAELAATGIRALVLDAETGPTRLGLGRRLARAIGADHVPLDEVDSDGRGVERAIRDRLAAPASRP
ncbi:VWA domain-containing protein [Acidiferrimicrobium sp. IK]|uniref:VWA domain-containing protein n=1 Tax=Acidiferrimicrobium sp. IK TaxID=2871700 RepID=UPI0021CB234E|nr:VWA domain-containing protein [Acidiferrimicrobium sp. IK]MCU4186269.1 VWA domain-containing protein [Acidiferrimicrobium sp. IK]